MINMCCIFKLYAVRRATWIMPLFMESLTVTPLAAGSQD